MNPLPARTALDASYLEARCKILDLAAILDRIGRGEGANETVEDARLEKLREAIEVLLDKSPARAERVQQIFSLAYDPTWEKPKPRF
jgi:hypothetical protein